MCYLLCRREVRSLPRIALIADPHFSLRSKAVERKWQDEWWWKLLPRTLKRSMYFSFEARRPYIEHVIARIKATGPYDFAVVLGDITPGVGRNGMASEEAERDAEAFINRMGAVGCPVYYTLGGHDLGRGQTISQARIESAQSLFGPLFFSKLWNGTRCVFLCSELARECNIKDAAVVTQHKNQLAFLFDEIVRKQNDVVLFMHDSRALHVFNKILGTYPRRVKATFCGHYHYAALGSLLRSMGGLSSSYNMHVVPSPWGWFFPGVGRGTFTVVEKGWGGQLKIRVMR